MANSAVFLDTNVVADMIDAQRKHHKDSLRLLQYLSLENYEIVISEDMISTLYYISEDKEATLAFLEHIVYPDWRVVPFGIETIKEATQIAMQTGTDLEDLLQCLCAKRHGCRYLITGDKRFVECGLDVVDYDGFFACV